MAANFSKKVWGHRLNDVEHTLGAVDRAHLIDKDKPRVSHVRGMAT